MRLNARTRGFKILEVLIGLAVLTISATGLAYLHTSVASGLESSSDISAALDIATQQIEELAALGANPLPSCVRVGPSPPRCALNRRNFETALSSPCTINVSGPDVPFAGSGSYQPAGRTRYRVDSVVWEHDDPTAQVGGFILSVSVCWEDIKGNVHQVQARRMLVTGV
jgi:type II secretory pathway pseudopilin PulG